MSELPKLPLVLSHTSLSAYKTCPLRFYRKYIAKDAADDTKTFQQTDGILVHNVVRKRIKLREPLPEFAIQYEPMLAGLERLPGDRHVEIQMAIDAQGRVCEYRSPAARFCGIADYITVNHDTAFILDWKTGKPYEDAAELRTLALLLRARFPHLKKITGAYYWFRTSTMGPNHPVVDDTARTWGELVQDANSIARRIASNDWPADEGPLCGWCPCSREQCEHKKDRPR